MKKILVLCCITSLLGCNVAPIQGQRVVSSEEITRTQCDLNGRNCRTFHGETITTVTPVEVPESRKVPTYSTFRSWSGPSCYPPACYYGGYTAGFIYQSW